MKRLLGEAGFFAYLDALNQPYTRALRVNLLLRPDGTPPCPIEGLGAPVPWARGAYFVEGDARPGLSPLHEGGLFYMQEPSALTAVTAIRTALGDELFVTEAAHAVAALAGPYKNSCSVYKHISPHRNTCGYRKRHSIHIPCLLSICPKISNYRYYQILKHICPSVKSFFPNNFQSLFKLAVFRVRRGQGDDDIGLDADAVDFAAIGRPILGDGHFDG